jgi:nitrite reductase/ring-hydroxylating ferredoxin subunit
VSINKIRICDVKQLTDPGSWEFVLSQAEGEIEAFLVQKDGLVTAFLNSCPHTGVALNWGPHQFWDVEGEYIQCSLHGAIFRPEDGYCVRGPCVGESLKSLPVVIEAGAIWIDFD